MSYGPSPKEQVMEQAIISKVKIYPRGSNYRLAFTWVYSVKYPRVVSAAGSQFASFPSLDMAERVIRKHGFEPKRDWV